MFNSNNDKETFHTELAIATGNPREYIESHKHSLGDWLYQALLVKFPAPKKRMKFRPEIKDGKTIAELPGIKWLCPTLGLRPGPIQFLTAFSNGGKSWLAATLAICVANSIPLLGSIEITNPGRVLYLDYDASGSDDTKFLFKRILKGIKDIYHNATMENVDVADPANKLDTVDGQDELRDLLVNYKLCIVDCFGASQSGDINDHRIRHTNDLINKISVDTGCTILMLHHEPKSASTDKLRAPKGSSSIVESAGGSMRLDYSPEAKTFHLELGKKRMTQAFDISYTLSDCGEWVAHQHMYEGIVLTATESTKKVSTIDLALQNLVDSAMTSSEFKAQLKIKTALKTATLQKLIEDKLVDLDPSTKLLTLTDEGKAYLGYSL